MRSLCPLVTPLRVKHFTQYVGIQEYNAIQLQAISSTTPSARQRADHAAHPFQQQCGIAAVILLGHPLRGRPKCQPQLSTAQAIVVSVPILPYQFGTVRCLLQRPRPQPRGTLGEGFHLRAQSLLRNGTMLRLGRPPDSGRPLLQGLDKTINKATNNKLPHNAYAKWFGACSASHSSNKAALPL
jgi:hypothetical protein